MRKISENQKQMYLINIKYIISNDICLIIITANIAQNAPYISIYILTFILSIFSIYSCCI